jgi:hypothetical protein
VPDPLLRFRLPDGRPATLRLGEASTVLAVDGELVSSWDLSGRPYALVRESGTYRRGLDGGLLLKREATAEAPRVRSRLSASEGAPILEAARSEAIAALRSLRAGRPDAGPEAAARDRLRTIAAMDVPALAGDAARFAEACGRVGILPPDQYLSLVVRLTEGCSWNACSFCSLYRDVPFRCKPPRELARHVAALRAYFGPSIALRRSLFLGDANALCLPQHELVPLLETVAAAFAGLPLFSFVDAWTGRRKRPRDWRECAALGLRRVYVGLETGDPGLLAWLGKPGRPQDAVELVGALHEGGVAAAAIVLLGAGGERFDEAHVARTAEALSAMGLTADDILYFSEYAPDPSLAYGRRAAGAADLQPLPPRRARAQRDAITSALRHGDGAPPRVASYDIREFVY